MSFGFAGRGTSRSSMLSRSGKRVTADVPNFIDLRVIGMEVDKKDRKTGTFLVTSTKNTLPALYNIMVTGRLMGGGSADRYLLARSFRSHCPLLIRRRNLRMRPLLLLASACGLFAAEPVTFLRDVAPILNKASCTSGPCHGAAKGKNGFKLSLRGYDPQFDYEALLYDLSGRRFNRADPGRSLMLAKPTQQVAHGGGLRFEKNSSYYKTIFDWIAQGVPYGDPAKDAVVALDVEPQRSFMTKPGETAAVKVVAPFRRRQHARCHQGGNCRIEHSRRG